RALGRPRHGARELRAVLARPARRAHAGRRDTLPAGPVPRLDGMAAERRGARLSEARAAAGPAAAGTADAGRADPGAAIARCRDRGRARLSPRGPDEARVLEEGRQGAR